MIRRVRYRCGVLLLVAGGLGVAIPVVAQDAGTNTPTYDVVSVKPNPSGPGRTMISNSEDGYSGKNISIKMLIMDAYDLKIMEQVAGLSGAIGSAGFDLTAKMDEETIAALKKLPKNEANAQRRLMMQALLADRFHLKVHHEIRDLQMYSLVVAKGGPKLKESDAKAGSADGPKGMDGGPRSGMRMENGKMSAEGVPIAMLSTMLGRQLHAQVTDKTGLTGNYDMTLEWSPEEMAGRMLNGAPADTGPSIFTALQEQLGLKLDSSKGPVDTIVVDHVEMPSEN